MMTDNSIDNTRRRPSLLTRFVRVVLVIFNILLAIGLIASSYAGAVNPDVQPVASLIAMTLPLWLISTLIFIVIDILVWWPTACFTALVFIICLPPILEYCPMHILSPKAPDGEPTFTIMTYNTYGLVNQHNEYPGDINQTINYILNSDADIICLQETPSLAPDRNTHITPEQVDSLHKLYPYVFKAGRNQNVLSKFPLEPVSTGFVPQEAGTFDMACYRATIHGRKVTIFNVHMRSFWLVYDERELYLNLTKGNEESIKLIREKLISKITRAAVFRARETKELIGYIRRFGGPDVIVCGDFNDIPGCYSLRLLERKSDLHSVASDVGFGPMITYNADRFYFRIDHILYRGGFKPLNIRRGNISASDHYPLTATFCLTN